MLDRLMLVGFPLLLLAIFMVGTGCETSGRRDAILPDVSVGDAALPVGAERVAAGRDGELSYTAEADGVLYLYDNQEKEIVHIQQVDRGERFTVAPERNLATLDGRPVAWDEKQPRLRTGRVYELYFYRSVAAPAKR